MLARWITFACLEPHREIGPVFIRSCSFTGPGGGHSIDVGSPATTAADSWCSVSEHDDAPHERTIPADEPREVDPGRQRVRLPDAHGVRAGTAHFA